MVKPPFSGGYYFKIIYIWILININKVREQETAPEKLSSLNKAIVFHQLGALISLNI